MARNKDYNYFDKFVELVDFSCKSAEILHNSLANFNYSTLEKRVAEMHSIEHSGDLAKHEMMSQLAREFIAPIEREDIITLSQEIDDITDTIEDVLIKIHMYNISYIRPDVLQFTKLIVESCKHLKVVFEEFPHYKKSAALKEKIVEVNNIEEDGDRLYHSTVRNLFVNSKDPIELLVWTEIYNLLEKCCDACEETADTVESIVMKNS